MIPATHYVILSAFMFFIGVVGVVVRRNAIVMFMCIELMLNAVNISFVAFSRMVGNLEGQIAVFFIMVVAASEAAVGLAIVLALFRAKKTTSTSGANELSL